MARGPHLHNRLPQQSGAFLRCLARDFSIGQGSWHGFASAVGGVHTQGQQWAQGKPHQCYRLSVNEKTQPSSLRPSPLPFQTCFVARFLEFYFSSWQYVRNRGSGKPGPRARCNLLSDAAAPRAGSRGARRGLLVLAPRQRRDAGKPRSASSLLSPLPHAPSRSGLQETTAPGRGRTPGWWPWGQAASPAQDPRLLQHDDEAEAPIQRLGCGVGERVESGSQGRVGKNTNSQRTSSSDRKPRQ